MTGPSPLTLPPPVFADSLYDSNPICPPACQQQRVDAVHITGDDSTFYVLSAYEQQRLERAINAVEGLIKDFQGIVSGLPEQPQACIAGQRDATEETCGCQACQKLLWAREAERAGLLSLHQARVQAEDIRLTTDEDVQGRIADLLKQREEFARLCGWFSHDDVCLIGKKVGAALDAEVDGLKTRLSAVQKRTTTIATTTLPDTSLGARQVAGASVTRARSGNRVVEVIVLSRPDRRYYISQSAADGLRSAMRVTVGRRPASTRLDGAGLKNRAGELVRDIRQQVGQRVREDLAKPLGQLEARLKSWKFPQDSAINALHQEFDWTSDSSEHAPYAVSTEAHLMRFAAQASAGFSGFDPEAGTISLGAKGLASYALGEGKITFAAFQPSQGGRDCYFSYRNAEGLRVYHRFGAFRLRGALELSCFVGAVGAGNATAGVKWKDAPSGASALLLSPELDSRGGTVQVKGSLFAGVQFGGALTGALEWMAPDIQYRQDAQWAALVELRAEGNVAYGAGATLDFQITLTGSKLYFHGKGELVFGPGAGGGFGTLVDLEKVGELMGVVYHTLSEVDFRHLFSINEEAFVLFYRGVSQLLSEPKKTLNEVMKQGPLTLKDWWQQRARNIASSGRLAERILNNEPLQLGTQRIPLCRLPPEILGPALYVLSDFYLFAFKNQTEKAIVHLLKQVSSWRQFYLILERMHPTAEVVSAVDSVKRIRSYLSRAQAQEFSNFIKRLAEHAGEAVPGQPLPQWLPWQPMNANDKYKTLLAAREIWAPEGGRYV